MLQSQTFTVQFWQSASMLALMGAGLRVAAKWLNGVHVIGPLRALSRAIDHTRASYYCVAEGGRAAIYAMKTRWPECLERARNER